MYIYVLKYGDMKINVLFKILSLGVIFRLEFLIMFVFYYFYFLFI